MTMLQGAVGVFAVAALGGAVLAGSVLRGRLAPWGLSLLHAALGATGLVLTALVLFGQGDAPANAGLALLLLVIAALGGFFLASFHLRGRPGPKPVVLIHAGVAVVGFVLLASAAFGLF
jgi:hypothetical protein